MNTPVSSATAEATTSGDGGPPPLKSIRLSTATDEGSEGSCPTPTPLQPKPKGVSKGSGGATTSGGKPRGRPPGAKNKVASGGGGEKPPKVKKSAANSQQPQQQQQKKLPIYHNAHKLYQVSLKFALGIRLCFFILRRNSRQKTVIESYDLQVIYNS